MEYNNSKLYEYYTAYDNKEYDNLLIADIKKGIEENNPYMCLILADKYTKEDNYKQKSDYLDQAIEIVNNNYENDEYFKEGLEELLDRSSHENLCYYYKTEDDLYGDKAFTYLNNLKEIRNNNFLMYTLQDLGICYLSGIGCQKDIDKAKECYKLAIDKAEYPFEWDAICEYAYFLCGQNDYSIDLMDCLQRIVIREGLVVDDGYVEENVSWAEYMLAFLNIPTANGNIPDIDKAVKKLANCNYMRLFKFFGYIPKIKNKPALPYVDILKENEAANNFFEILKKQAEDNDIGLEGIDLLIDRYTCGFSIEYTFEKCKYVYRNLEYVNVHRYFDPVKYTDLVCNYKSLEKVLRNSADRYLQLSDSEYLKNKGIKEETAVKIKQICHKCLFTLLVIDYFDCNELEENRSKYSEEELNAAYNKLMFDFKKYLLKDYDSYSSGYYINVGSKIFELLQWRHSALFVNNFAKMYNAIGSLSPSGAITINPFGSDTMFEKITGFLLLSVWEKRFIKNYYDSVIKMTNKVYEFGMNFYDYIHCGNGYDRLYEAGKKIMEIVSLEEKLLTEFNKRPIYINKNNFNVCISYSKLRGDYIPRGMLDELSRCENKARIIEDFFDEESKTYWHNKLETI